MTMPGLNLRSRLVKDGLDNRSRLCQGGLDDRSRLVVLVAEGGQSPVAVMLPATNIYAEGMTLNGQVQWDGLSGGTITQRGFEWGETEGYGNEWYESGSWTQGFTFSHAISVLKTGVLYYARVKIVYTP